MYWNVAHALLGYAGIIAILFWRMSVSRTRAESVQGG